MVGASRRLGTRHPEVWFWRPWGRELCRHAWDEGFRKRQAVCGQVVLGTEQLEVIALELEEIGSSLLTAACHAGRMAGRWSAAQGWVHGSRGRKVT